MSEQLEMRTPDLSLEKIRKIGELFPNCITESAEADKIVIDFDALQQELSSSIVNGNRERYQFTWPEKNKSIMYANQSTSMTLRPCKAESVNFETTKNLYIEGDNLEALKILRKTYRGKIKMIYVDPPYNTGTDFVYRDNFSMSKSEYSTINGEKDEDGNRLVKNPKDSGRFHTNWLNMMYPRLMIARDFLSDDGIIFLSIDDNEVTNLRKMCDEIFGEKNFVAQIVVEGTPKSDPIIISTAHEYCLAYVKNIDSAKQEEWGISNPVYDKLIALYDQYSPDYDEISKKLKEFYISKGLNSDNISNYKYADEQGIYRIGPIDDPQNNGPKDLRLNPLTGNYCITPSSGWRCTKETWNEWISNNLICFPADDSCLPSKKTYITKGQLDVLRAYRKIQTRKDTDMLKKMFDGKKVFLFPKPLDFIENLIEASTKNGDIVLDFFSGSATTAHAVIRNCMKTQKSINFILIQLPENMDETLKNTSNCKSKKSLKDAIDYCNSRNVPPNICEIAKERIRKAGNETKQRIDAAQYDVGFRVFKLDSSNMNDVYYAPSKLTKNTLDSLISNVKSDRSGEDLLFQVMLECNIELSAKITKTVVYDKEVYFVDEDYMIAYFDDDANEELITEIAKKKPRFVVFKDCSMQSDAVAINIGEIFKAYSPDTRIKIL